jgi:hypothetical protein
MTFKSLLLAATVAGGLALGASAASAQVEKYTVTGSDPAYLGTFDVNLNYELPGSTSANFFFGASAGTGVYTGITEVSFSPLGGTLTLFEDSTPLAYVVDIGTNPASILDVNTLANTTDTIGASAVPEASIWLLMFAGVAMLGSALRFSRKQGAFAAA